MAQGTVTIFTDMSLKLKDETLRISTMGYAYFIASDRGKKYGSSVVREFKGNTFEAEAYAVAFALRDAKKFYGTDLIKAYVYCDNMGVVSTLKKYDSYLDLNTFEGKLIKYIKDLGYTELDVRHVKGHQRAKHKQAYLNNRVDKLSREARRMAETVA